MLNTEELRETEIVAARTTISEPLHPGHDTLFEYSTTRPTVPDAHFRIKRIVDVITAGGILVLLSPFILIIAALIKIESRGSILFSQKRSLGGDDHPFDFYKFRSMHVAADVQKDGLLENNESDGALFKMKNDPRLTRVGKFIRKYSLDELPQLLNVLKGDMSLVGPRPLPVEDYERITRDHQSYQYYRLRSNATPGMTGLWQVSGRSNLGFHEMVMLDLEYIKHWSLLTDVRILIRTIPVVLFGRGAY
ncbi:MAG: sugar transferase [Bacteroidota bacterium]